MTLEVAEMTSEEFRYINYYTFWAPLLCDKHVSMLVETAKEEKVGLIFVKAGS